MKILEGGTTFRQVCAEISVHIEKGLKMAGDSNKHAICAPLLSLLA